MKFSYNWLKDLISGKLPEPVKLADLLNMHSFEVNEIKRAGSDWMIDIDVLPNRGPDCFSHTGIAREVAVITSTKLKINPSTRLRVNAEQRRSIKEEKFIEDRNSKIKDFMGVDVKHLRACPRYTARVLHGITVGPSPKFIQERLKVCGLRPINNIVDITNYVMLETGQPLHAFDGEKLEGQKIIVRFARNNEKITTLDGEKYDLDRNILVIADDRKPIAIAGIKGGKIPEVTKRTKIIIIESANFSPQIIRRGSQRLNLKTDASLRFEHGIDPNLTEIAVNQAASLMQKITGGRIQKDLIDFYPKKVLSKKVNLDLNYVERLLGVKISKDEITKILRDLGFKISQLSKLKLQVEIPTRRLDISLPEDLIEEIGRIYGYKNIPATFPLTVLSPPRRNDLIFWEDFSKRILKELSLTEVYNYSFLGEELRETFGYKVKELIEIENPVSVKQKYLRPSLIPNLLVNLKTNLKYFDNIRIFELGKIYRQGRMTEKRMLSVAILKKEGGSRSQSEIFLELKGIIDALLNQLGISNIWYDSYKPNPAESKTSFWQLKKSAEIKIDRKKIGFLGIISPKILDKLKITENLVFFEIDFDELAQLCSEEHEFRPLSRYPAAVRDLAILVPGGILVEEVLNIINVVGGRVVRDVDLFDIYEGQELPEGKKNLAFHIIYQAQDKTLKSSEIDKIHQKIIKALEKKPEWQVRQ